MNLKLSTLVFTGLCASASAFVPMASHSRQVTKIAVTKEEQRAIDKALEANKNRQQQLEALAAQGNLTAQQSISAEIKRELELERQKEALEKKKKQNN